MTRRRYVVCGLSNRGLAGFVLPLLGGGEAREHGALGFGGGWEDLSAHGEVVAVVDPDRRRVEQFNAELLPGGPGLLWFAPGDFETMVAEVNPDTVIVTSPDHTHADYILAALDHDLDVITEKPMVSTAEQAARVLAAEQASRGSVLVTHNLRYTPRHRRIKELLRAGAVGRPVHVLLEYHVDIRHGASYFLRWNRLRARSGGLSVHKSTHHLDLVSWWLDDTPERVFALGGRHYYGPDSPHRPRDAAGAPYEGQALRRRDPYYLAQLGSSTFPPGADDDRRGLFGLRYAHEYPAGAERYLYDDEIDIEDSYSALVGYTGGASLAYSIDFSSPWEGYRVVINGTHGQLEASTGRLPSGEPMPGAESIVHRPIFGSPDTIELEAAAGGHDGADPLLRQDLFVGPSELSTELGLLASSADGASAVAAGEAIWRSIAEGRQIDVSDLLAPR
ncbi:Gfo/Idh/MocA family oxidoreductase [Jiangella gansuensis]|uniref:Gfo/Idh/MocA family oxidoreductase n=1 Tax=Jiangella gansuensis TaxID=281473 RepID=UPI00047C081D|nr:Gfo/Idh/MocA family oxidoreductase [Jiangella gansuensis]